MKKIVLLAFIALALLQWLVPGKMIWERGTILNRGTAFKLETEPVDPYHPFKGRYVALNFSESQFLLKKSDRYSYGQDIYLRLLPGENGYAKIFSASAKPPSGSSDYIKATVSFIDAGRSDSLAIMHVNYPFREYYMDEFKAPKAEKIYNDSARAGVSDTYALVKVYNGGAVVEDLFIKGKSIRERLK